MKVSAKNGLLRPFSGVFGLVTDIRNWLYNNQLKAVHTPRVRTLNVGNLTVGGTGKTPMVEFLIDWQAHRAARSYETVTLSRGYGRQTRGFRVASAEDTAATIGDEPLQLFRKYGHRVRVCVGERRADAIQAIERQFPETKLILLDDAFQHRAVQPQTSLLLTDYIRPFYADHPFPAGRLRERRHGASRADAVVVTKCPLDLLADAQQIIVQHIRRYTRPDVPVFFAGLRYGRPVRFADQQPADLPGPVVLVSGLANADPLDAYVRTNFARLHHHRYPDHYAYTRADLNRLVQSLPDGAALLTTEKDWVKLDALLTAAERAQWPLYYLPVRMEPLADSAAGFEQFLRKEYEQYEINAAP